MLKEFQRFVSENNLVPSGARVLLAVSGGMDSMAMLRLFQQSRFPVAVAHVNFQLRGEDSIEDEKFVKAQCELLKIPVFTKRFETNNYATQHGLSIQMAARQLRYEWFNELLREHAFHSVATAHHLNDSIETILLNLTHGKGLEGITGIPIQRSNVIRPLLFATRNQIEDYVAKEIITWREDSSNQTTDYERNFVRHLVVPLLKQLNPGLEETLNRTSQKARLESDLLKETLEGWKVEHLLKAGATWRITKASLNGSHVGKLMLSYALEEFGFNYEQCGAMVLALSGQPGKLFYSSNYQAVVDRDEIIVSLRATDVSSIEIEKEQRECTNGTAHLVIELDIDKALNGDHAVAQLDLDRITFPITWRRWQDGDRFQPLGMDHSKKVSDFLIDQKIPRSEKEKITVLESAGEIVWLVGLRIDHRVRVRPETKSVIGFRLLQHK